jgi:hypothetical protein
MALRGQSFLLWPVLIVALASCAGQGEIQGPGQGGTGGPGNGGSGGSVGGCSSGQSTCGSECKDLSDDQLNCGACGHACGTGQTCQAGQCQCSAQLLACNGACVPADVNNCGGCNTKCGSGQVCSANSCQSSCGAGETQCSAGACVDTTNNALNCGGCGMACPAGSVCNGGTCGCAAAGQMLCGNACVDTMTSNANCGGCGQACAGTCMNGACLTMPGGAVLLPPSIRRMTNAEYDASVQALLGTSMTPSTSFPPDSRQGAGFTLNDAQRVDPVMAKAMDDAAQALVTEARNANKFSTLAPCSNPAAQGETCAKTFINSFGAKAFRRAVTSSELTDLVALYHAGADSPGTYNEGIDLVTRGILQSVGFLYVTALGNGGSGTIKLTNDELASNLSYLVAGSPPDQTLMDMSTSGGLASPDARETQARRLLTTQPGHDRMVRVVREWLGVDRISETAKDSTVYGDWTNAMRTSMDGESRTFIDEVVQRSTGTVGELLSANWSIYDSGLNALYGMPSAGATAHTSLPKRLGILNQAAFLSVYAHAQETAPVLRGVAIMRRVACMKLPDPQSLNIQVVPPAPDPAKSTRDRYDIHATDAACASCHATIDQIGFSFEMFDAEGKQRPPGTMPGTYGDTHQGAAPNTTKTVDTHSDTTIVSTSQFPSDFAGAYADSNALAMALGNSAQVRECLARQMFRSSAGKSDDSVANAEQSFVTTWKAMSSDQQGKFIELLVAYVRSPLFDSRSAP